MRFIIKEEFLFNIHVPWRRSILCVRPLSEHYRVCMFKLWGVFFFWLCPHKDYIVVSSLSNFCLFTESLKCQPELAMLLIIIGCQHHLSPSSLARRTFQEMSICTSWHKYFIFISLDLVHAFKLLLFGGNQSTRWWDTLAGWQFDF